MLLTQIGTSPRCARCGGPMYRGLDDEQTCLHCGEVVYAPEPVLSREEREAWSTEMRPKRGRPRKAAALSASA